MFTKRVDRYAGRKAARWRQGVLIAAAACFAASGPAAMTGCTATRFLAEGEEFYTGHEIELEAEDKIPEKSRLRRELDGVVRPDPTPALFGALRPRVWLYYALGTPERGPRAWMKRRLGRAPVLFERVAPEHTAALIADRLHNNGYFDATVAYDVRRGRKTAEVRYNALLRRPYRIGRIVFPASAGALEREIAALEGNSILRTGDLYNLDRLRGERERIDDELKESGYFFFSPDFLKFYADTTRQALSVDLHLTVKPDMPPRAVRRYRIGNVLVYPDHVLEPGAGSERPDTLFSDGLAIVARDLRLRPELLAGSIFLRTGDLYERRKRAMTVNRLMGLGLFKFANVRFLDVGDDVLDAHVYLTPLKERSLRVELQAVSKSNDFAGPGLNMQYLSRNFRRGAAQLSLGVGTGFETQLGGVGRGIDSYEYGFETELLIPRIVSPLRPGGPAGMFVPKTRIKAEYQSLRRVDLFHLNSFGASYGFMWNRSARSRHQLSPVSVNYVRSGGFSQEFEQRLQLFPALRRSFEQQFIVGATYSWFYNTQVDDWRRHQRYFNANVDVAGNLLYGVISLARGRTGGPEDSHRLFGIAFSQYARLDMDFRYFLSLGESSRLATRFIGGVGVPYGNSSSMPYVKQFFVGGTNSVRAFQARSIGPGTYRPEEDETGFFVDRTGDIRLEANVEYRFPLAGILHGALFADAGNIWMVRNEREREGTTFDFDAFVHEFAVGSGLGLRLDASFFVLRLDVAFPLRKPYLPAGERWVARDIRLGSSRWRRDNLTYNLAIGYPF